MAAETLVGISVPFSGLIRRHLFMSVVRVTRAAFHHLILFGLVLGRNGCPRRERQGMGHHWTM